MWGLSNGIVGGVGGPELTNACRTRTADPNYAKPFPTWSRQRGLSNECSNTQNGWVEREENNEKVDAADWNVLITVQRPVERGS